MARKRKMTVTVLPAQKIPRRKQGKAKASRSTGFAGGDVRPGFTLGRRLQEVERVMTSNGRRKLRLELEALQRRREELSVLDRQPWKIRTLAAESRIKIQEREEARRLRELGEKQEAQARLKAVEREAQVRAAFRWRQEQYKLRKEGAGA